MTRRPSTHPTRFRMGVFRAQLVMLLLGGALGRAHAQDASLPGAVDAATGADAGAAQPAPSGAAATVSAPGLALPQGDAGYVAPLMNERERATDLKYLLERVVIRGNRNTKERQIRKFIPIETGSAFQVSDPEIEALRYRLLGTGWYDRVVLRLERGAQPGWVVLVIELEERPSLAFQQLAAGVGWSPIGKDARQPEPYLGLAVADTNFLGTGRTLGGELLLALDQQGFAIGYNDAVVGASRWGLHARTTFVNGQEYFGGDQGVQVSRTCPMEEPDRCLKNAQAAVVDYWRAGLTLGTGRDLGSFTRITLDWHGDFVRVPPGGMPDAAIEQRGRGDPAPPRRAIDFAIEPDNSFVSMLSVGVTYDKRDSAILPSRGLLASFLGDVASPLIGSDYEFIRLQGSVNRWFPLRWGHTIRTGLYAGAVHGNAPFFYKFFVTDLTDLMPSRILGLNLDHRPAPNLFGVFQCGRTFDPNCGTAIAQMRHEELSARVDVEYVWPMVRDRRKFLKGADGFFLIGLYALADTRDLQVAIPGYSGIARLPIDLTLDAGVRLDTQIGVFQIGLAKLLWLPVVGPGAPSDAASAP